MGVDLLFDYGSRGCNKHVIPREYDLTTSRIVVLGDSMSGKTSLITRWVNNTFSYDLDFYTQFNHGGCIYHKSIIYERLIHSHNFDEYRLISKEFYGNNLEGNCLINLHLDEQDKVRLSNLLDVQILDTNNDDILNYSELQKLQFSQADGFILCYDSNNEQSLENLEFYYRQIELSSKTHPNLTQIPLVACATESDSIKKKISPIKSIEYCRNFNIDYNKNHFYISSKSNNNINEAFFTLLQSIELIKQEKRNKNRESKKINEETIFSIKDKKDVIGNYWLNKITNVTSKLLRDKIPLRHTGMASKQQYLRQPYRHEDTCCIIC